MATPRESEQPIETAAGPVTVHLTVPGGASHVPVVLVPGVPDEATGRRIGLRLARGGFAVAWWFQPDPSVTLAVVEAAHAGILVGATPPSFALLHLPQVPLPAVAGATGVEWPGDAPDAEEPARLDEGLDEVVRQLMHRLP